DQVAGLESGAIYGVQVRLVVDAADELEVARAPGCVLAHRGHVFLDGQLAGRIVPGQWQVHDPRGDFQIPRRADGVPFARDGIEQLRQWQGFRLVVHLQRADARREVDDSVERLALQRLHQGVAAEAQHQVQLRLADLQ